jgi:SAM-dependent methyltransferase
MLEMGVLLQSDARGLSMGIYETYVLPRVLDGLCSMKPFMAERGQAVAAASGTLLEIGFGSGLNLPYLPPAVERVLAVDPSLGARKVGAKRIAAARVPVDFIGLDAEVIHAESGSADCALSTFTLCSIPDAQKALREVRRILKPGGKLLFLEHGHAPDEAVARWQARLNPLERTVLGGCNLDRDIVALLRGAGFEIQSLETRYLHDIPRTHGYIYAGMAT